MHSFCLVWGKNFVVALFPLSWAAFMARDFQPTLRPAAAAAARPILQEMLLLSQVRSQISLCTVYVRSLFYGPRLGMDENLHKASQPVDGAKLYSPALTLARALSPQTCGSAPLVSNEQRKKSV